MNSSLSVHEIVAMDAYVVGMAAFTVGCLFNLIAFITIIVSGLAKQSSGLFLLVILISDFIYLFTHTVIDQFYTKWIKVDIFELLGGDGGIALCQAWNFVEEATMYLRQMIIVALLIDRCLYVTGKSGKSTLKKGALFGISISALIAAGLSGYWAYKVIDILPEPYTFGSCAIAPPDGEKWSDVWWMTFIVHIVLPDAVLEIMMIIMLFVLIGGTRCKTAKRMADNDHNLTNVIIGYVIVQLVIRIPFILINCVLLYLDKWHDLYDFPENHWSNIKYSGIVLGQVKEVGHAVNFFVLCFIVEFRNAFFCSRSN